ncbi:hypothetical protein [Streptomyces sp. NPDC051561]|uniref:hypothetical protein n=1 Tax=Streptomyces sp. NPDC051561 TaxID=3365658 RepID=UPI0037B687EE
MSQARPAGTPTGTRVALLTNRRSDPEGHIMKTQMTKAYISLTMWSKATVQNMRERQDRGASVVEYAGLVVIIALIVVAVNELDLDTTISEAISDAVDDIVGG